jgi:hypothetical protein
MTKFNYDASAELFPSRRFARSLGRYRRFDTAAEAIQHVVEEMPASWLPGTIIDTEDGRLEGAAIRAFYDAPDYPLTRGKLAA